MSYIIDRLVQRLIVERLWTIVTDVDEVSQLPNEEALLDQLEAETDEQAQDELLIQYLESLTRHANSAPLIGGPLPDFDDVAEVDGSPINVISTAPALRTLKPYCSRIAIKVSSMAIKVALFIDGPISKELTREKLIATGKAFRADFEQALEAEEQDIAEASASKSKRKAKKKKLLPVAIVFELIQVGSHIDTPQTRAVLRALRCRFSRKDRAFISGALLDSTTKQVWTTRGIFGYLRRRNLRYELENCDQKPSEIREAIKSSTINWNTVLLSIVIAVFATGLNHFSQLTGDLSPLILYLGDVLIPMVVILFAVSFERLQIHSARQTKYFLIGYFGIYIGTISWMVWPLSVGLGIYMLKVTLFVSFVSMLASTMMELE